MKKTKQLIVLAIVAMGALFLAGCGDGSITPGQASEAGGTLQLWKQQNK